MRYTRHFSTRQTPQSQPIPGSFQVSNSAGGYAFPVDDWTRLDRFLILGNEGGSYYAAERTLTVENATAIARCLKEDGHRVVDRIVEISEAGRAPKNDPALFALAMAASPRFSDRSTITRGLTVLPRVARIGTHLFQFADAVNHFRGWGRALRDAVASWYTAKSVSDLAYQVVKYQSRGGWSHRDLLRLSHPNPSTPAYDQVFHWITQGALPSIPHPDFTSTHIVGYELAKRAASPREIVVLITNYNLTREMIPTKWLNSPIVWDALLQRMPVHALVRNLGKMSAVGLLKPMSDAVRLVRDRLSSDAVLKARLHPLQILIAMNTYAQGRGVRGGLTCWEVVPQVVDALDLAYYHSFGAIEPTGKRWLLALDVSGSMGWGEVAGMPGLTPRIGAAAMSMVTARVEQDYHIVAFAHKMRPINITPRQRLDDVVRITNQMDSGGTDCALPMLYALKHKIPVDVFTIYTDAETWYGDIHPVQALARYRSEMGIPAKLIVVGMLSNGFSIADPNDSGMLDVVGFDTAVPQVMADFAR